MLNKANTDEPGTDTVTATERKVKEVAKEEKQVIVHCAFTCPPGEAQLIRIWKTTYLIPKGSSHRCQLLFWENITIYPQWTPIEGGKTHTFTLIFSGLPSNCSAFDFLEDIPQNGGFFVANIPRNETDVYHVTL
jgi:hypothetical protein